MGVNASLKRRMVELGLTQDELARQMNDALEEITGRPGDVSARSVRNLLNGRTRRPIGRTCAALEKVFGCPIGDLGFSPPRTAAPQEDPVRRRTFITSTTGTAAAAAVPLLASQRKVGTSDVQRARYGLQALTVLDDHQGGHAKLEKAALAGAQSALDLQQNGASERVRRQFFCIAAEYTCWAGWSCIDVRDLDGAQRHLDRSMTLAGMAQDSAVQFQVWNSIAMLARQRERYGDAVAAGKAAQALSITRRDPFFASLAHARTAIGHSHGNDRQAALRSLGCAQEALAKVSSTPRPSWVDFYGPAELSALTAIVQTRLGAPADAEYASHQALSAIPERFRRNRALATTQLAFAQLQQGDLDLACDTAASVFDIMGGAEIPGRMRTRLGDFHRNLLDRAPGTAQAHDWADRLRTKWS
jgi:transcriptional regulator with XRE-family HTH domain